MNFTKLVTFILFSIFISSSVAAQESPEDSLITIPVIDYEFDGFQDISDDSVEVLFKMVQHNYRVREADKNYFDYLEDTHYRTPYEWAIVQERSARVGARLRATQLDSNSTSGGDSVVVARKAGKIEKPKTPTFEEQIKAEIKRLELMNKLARKKVELQAELDRERIKQGRKTNKESLKQDLDSLRYQVKFAKEGTKIEKERVRVASMWFDVEWHNARLNRYNEETKIITMRAGAEAYEIYQRADGEFVIKDGIGEIYKSLAKAIEEDDRVAQVLAKIQNWAHDSFELRKAIEARSSQAYASRSGYRGGPGYHNAPPRGPSGEKIGYKRRSRKAIYFDPQFGVWYNGNWSWSDRYIASVLGGANTMNGQKWSSRDLITQFLDNNIRNRHHGAGY